jgi:small-conductance mechanosensitive channel
MLAVAQHEERDCRKFLCHSSGGLFGILITPMAGNMVHCHTDRSSGASWHSWLECRKYRTSLLSLLAVAVAALCCRYCANANFPANRLQTSNSAAVASIVFVLAAALLLVTVALISQNRKFKACRLLLTSFAIIVMIPSRHDSHIVSVYNLYK